MDRWPKAQRKKPWHKIGTRDGSLGSLRRIGGR